jgi:hypothetical protein
LRVLSRPPTQEQLAAFVELLQPGYDARRVEPAPLPAVRPKLPRDLVGWSNHLDPEANVIKLNLEKAVRAGEPHTHRLQPDWRERMEDLVWTLMNSPEFAFAP